MGWRGEGRGRRLIHGADGQKDMPPGGARPPHQPRHRNSAVHCARVSSGLGTVWPCVRPLLKISWSLPPCTWSTGKVGGMGGAIGGREDPEKTHRESLVAKEVDRVKLLDELKAVRLVPPGGEEVERDLATHGEGQSPTEVPKLLAHPRHHLLSHLVLLRAQCPSRQQEQ